MHSGSPLVSILVVLLAALISASILLRLKQPNIIGFILAGILVGPHALGLVPYENVEFLAELGIGLLMFTIGAELSIHQLLRVRRVAILGGSGLILATVCVAKILAPVLHWMPTEATIWGLCAGISSTVVVLKLLAERGEVGSMHGNVSTGILLFQDLISIPILVFIPLIASSSNANTQEIIFTIGKMVLSLVVLYASARVLVPKFLRFVAHAHSKELFSIAVLCITFGIAGITNALGLSLSLGAFLAGLIVSESDFGNQAAAEILPLKDAFSAIFFVSVGMLLNITYFSHHWPSLLLGLCFIVLFKFVLLLAISFSFRFQAKITIFIALALAQVGEFGFLLISAAHKNDLIPEKSYQLLLGIAVLSIAITPYLLKLAPRIKKAFRWTNKTKWISRSSTLSESPENSTSENQLSGHIIVCGYGPTGSIITKKLLELGLQVVVVDLNYKMIRSLKKDKQFAVYGDSSSMLVLEAAYVDKAALLIVTIPDPFSMRALVRKVKRAHPNLPILLRVKYGSDRDALLSLGADDIVWEEFEAGQELTRRAMDRLGLS